MCLEATCFDYPSPPPPKTNVQFGVGYSTLRPPGKSTILVPLFGWGVGGGLPNKFPPGPKSGLGTVSLVCY